MALTAKMVTSEILMCGVKVGLKNIPVVGAGIDCAIDLVEGLQRRHEILLESRRMDNLEAQMSRVEKAMRDTINRQIQSILANLASPDLTGPVLTREIRELRHIQEQGWSPNLFEGLIRNSNHWQELKRNPHHYGRLLGDHDKVDPEKGIHLLLDAERTRVLELTPFAFARLLTHQTMGVPEAGTCASQDIWALSTQELARMVVSESNAVIAKFQWITAATVFADPYPEIDLLANRAIPLQMISELAGVYGIEVSTAQLKSIGAQMVQTELKLGLIEAATSLIAALFKSSLVGYATGAVARGLGGVPDPHVGPRI